MQARGRLMFLLPFLLLLVILVIFAGGLVDLGIAIVSFVIIGIIAFFRTWPSSTCFTESPFAKAVLT